MAGASTSNPNQFAIPGEILTFDNYQSWKAVMRRDLERLHLWSYIDSREENRIDLRKDKKVLDAIKNSCDEHMLPHIMYADFARNAWDWLAEAAAWTDEERGNYVDMLVRAATAKENSDEVQEVDKVLTRRNYTKWKIYMKNILLSKYLWTVVEGRDTIGSRSYQTKNHNALVIIRMSCGEEMFLQIDEEDNAKDAWCKLERKLGSDSIAAASEIESNKIISDRESDKVSYDFTNELFIGHELLTFKVDHKNVTISSNYDDWVLRMKNYLKNHGLWGFLEELEISDCVKDEKALDAIKASCAEGMRANILYVSCAKDAWYELAKRAAVPTEDEVRIHSQLCEVLNQAQRNKASEHSEAGKVLTRNNYQKWEAYVTMLLRSRFLYDVVLPFDNESYHGESSNYEIKVICALRIIKEACGPEMMPYIFRSKSPGDALTNLRKACSMDQQDDYMKYSRLLHAVKKNGFREWIIDLNGELWRGAHIFFRDFPEALTAEITEEGSTALHVAVRLGRVDFVRELLKLMPAEQTELKTHRGNTAIAVAAGGNDMEIVKMLIESNSHLPFIGNENELHAVTIAAINGNEMIMHYLYPLTSKSTNWWGARSVASFLTAAARLNAFDIVLDLLSYFPDYALVRDDYGMCTLLSVLAEKPSAFPSGNQFGFFKRWIYRLAGSKTHKTVLKALQIIVPGVNQVLNSKEKHDRTAAIVQCICSLLPNLNPHQLRESFITDAVYRSTIYGIVEVFKILIDTNPYLEHFEDEFGRGLFQIGVMYRQENIFQYMSAMGQRNQDMALLDNFGNNVLHCAAFWDPSLQLVHGPALQMQREIQWFQDVERVVPPRYKEMRNKDNLTPKTLFSLQHKDLAKEAEKWMKEMAQACIIVTALIATVMFAAPFTLPGGTDQNTGVSLSLQSRAFKVFIVSDVISLFASCTSLLMFFSILTARYAEPDFLISLPRRLILGLFTLFLSIGTMMATFTGAVVIVLRGEASRAYIWVSILACIPVVIFALLQLRLFGNLLLSTYGRNIFRSKKTVVAPLISVGYG